MYKFWVIRYETIPALLQASVSVVMCIGISVL
jgi:hypothetical protein